MHTSRLAISDLYKNGYTKHNCKSINVEANVLELDVRIDGLAIFPDQFFPEQTLVERRFNKLQPSLEPAIRQDFSCSFYYIPPHEEKSDEFSWYDGQEGGHIGKQNIDDMFQFDIVDTLTKSTIIVKRKRTFKIKVPLWKVGIHK